MKDGARRINDSIEQHPIASYDNDQYATLAAGKSRRLIASTPFGVLSQEKWLPMHLISGGIILEFELDDPDTCFTESGVSFQIEDVKLFSNLHTLIVLLQIAMHRTF